MEAKAQARFVRCTPQKARRIVNEVRGMRATEALDLLRWAPQSAAEVVLKIVESALANARYKADEAGERFDESNFVISTAFADEGPTMKRIQPRAQGRANRILKRTSHITIVVSDEVAAGSKRRTR